MTFHTAHILIATLVSQGRDVQHRLPAVGLLLLAVARRAAAVAASPALEFKSLDSRISDT